jgi:carbonic anhydrase
MIAQGPQTKTGSRRSKLVFTGAFAALVLSAVVFQSLANEPATNEPGSAHWGYTGFEGPLYWGTEFMPGQKGADGKYQSFDTCLNGISQSPISGTALNSTTPIPWMIKPGRAGGVVDDNGHAFQMGSLEMNKGLQSDSELSFNGDTYRLLQLHFHSPSEHRRWANGTYTAFDPVEMHLVHKNSTGRLSVVGVFIRSSGDAAKGNSEIATMQDNFGKGTTAWVDINKLLPANQEVWTYDGSLTTPPCTQGVRWLVMRNPITVSPQQLDWLQSKYKDNSRAASFEKIEKAPGSSEPSGLKQVSSGDAGVWGVDSGNNVYQRAGIDAHNLRGTKWDKRWSGFIYVASGKSGVWVVSTGNEVSYAKPDGKPAPLPSPQAKIYRISAGKYGVWALDTTQNVFKRTGITDSTPEGTAWKQYSTYKIKDITSGDFGVWGVDTNNVLYFLGASMEGSLEEPGGSSFDRVPTDISVCRVSSGPLGVWALKVSSNPSQEIVRRSGITAEPGGRLGSGWRIQDGKLNEITNGKYGVWGTNNNNEVYFLSSAPKQISP